MSDDKIYGVIAEWKEESPMVFEGPLMTYEQAHARMRDFASKPYVIRVAIFKAGYVSGHNALIPQESRQ